MSNSSTTLARRYGLALPAVFLAAAVRLVLYPYLGDRSPFLTFLFAIIVTAWYGGLGPALLAVVLSWLVVDHFLLETRELLPLFGQKSQIAFTFFVGGLIATLLTGAARSAWRGSTEE